MQIIDTPLAGLLLIEPRVFGDSRGYFFESYNRDVFAAQGITEEFIQDNESLSDRGVVRGLHFQAPPKAQGKLVRVQRGRFGMSRSTFARAPLPMASIMALS